MCIRDRPNPLSLWPRHCGALFLLEQKGKLGAGQQAVSYTHLDVYKRQSIARMFIVPPIVAEWPSG
ncbi:hypothetical protein [Erwinia amylovora]